MPCIALKGTGQIAVAFRLGIDGAAAAMGERHYAIDIVEAVKPARAIEMLSDIFGDGCRTIDRRDDADKIARANAAGAAVEAHEGPTVLARQHAGFFDIDAELIGMVGFDHRQVL